MAVLTQTQTRTALKELQLLIYGISIHPPEIPPGYTRESLEKEIWQAAEKIISTEDFKAIRKDEEPLLALNLKLQEIGQEKIDSMYGILQSLVSDYDRYLEEQRAQAETARRRAPTAHEKMLRQLNVVRQSIPQDTQVQKDVSGFMENVQDLFELHLAKSPGTVLQDLSFIERAGLPITTTTPPLKELAEDIGMVHPQVRAAIQSIRQSADRVLPHQVANVVADVLVVKKLMNPFASAQYFADQMKEIIEQVPAAPAVRAQIRQLLPVLGVAAAAVVPPPPEPGLLVSAPLVSTPEEAREIAGIIQGPATEKDASDRLTETIITTKGLPREDAVRAAEILINTAAAAAKQPSATSQTVSAALEHAPVTVPVLPVSAPLIATSEEAERVTNIILTSKSPAEAANAVTQLISQSKNLPREDAFGFAQVLIQTAADAASQPSATPQTIAAALRKAPASIPVSPAAPPSLAESLFGLPVSPPLISSPQEALSFADIITKSDTPAVALNALTDEIVSSKGLSRSDARQAAGTLVAAAATAASQPSATTQTIAAALQQTAVSVPAPAAPITITPEEADKIANIVLKSTTPADVSKEVTQLISRTKSLPREEAFWISQTIINTAATAAAQPSATTQSIAAALQQAPVFAALSPQVEQAVSSAGTAVSDTARQLKFPENQVRIVSDAVRTALSSEPRVTP